MQKDVEDFVMQCDICQRNLNIHCLRTDHPYMHPMAFCIAKDRHLWPIFVYLRIAKIFADHHKLFYKVDGSRAIGPHYQDEGDRFYMEGHNLQVRSLLGVDY